MAAKKANKCKVKITSPVTILTCAYCGTDIEVEFLNDTVVCPNCGTDVSKDIAGAARWVKNAAPVPMRHQETAATIDAIARHLTTDPRNVDYSVELATLRTLKELVLGSRPTTQKRKTHTDG